MRKRNKLTYLAFQRTLRVGDTVEVRWENNKAEKFRIASFSDITNEPVTKDGKHIWLDYIVRWPKDSLVTDTYYKIRRRTDGLFAQRNDGYGGTHWSKTGTLWRGIGNLKKAFKSSLKDLDSDEYLIDVFKLKRTASLRKKDILR